MVASGTTGTIATSSEAIMQDYKCGEIIGTKPRNLTIMQLIAVPIGAAAVSWMYPALVNAFGIVDRVDPKTGVTIPAGADVADLEQVVGVRADPEGGRLERCRRRRSTR